MTQKELNTLLNKITSYIISQVAWKRNSVSFTDVSKACDIKLKYLTENTKERQVIIKTLLENKRVIDADYCPFEQEFTVILKPISQCA